MGKIKNQNSFIKKSKNTLTVFSIFTIILVTFLLLNFINKFGKFHNVAHVGVATADNRLGSPNIIELANGDWLSVYYEDVGGVTSNRTFHCLKSTNKGETWSSLSTVATGCSNEPVLLQLANGNVLCFYGSSNSQNILFKLSNNNGLTWGNEQTVSEEASACREIEAIQLSGGRILCFYSIGVALYLKYSDDNGSNWSARKDVATGTWHWEEKSAIELSNGDVLLVSEDEQTEGLNSDIKQTKCTNPTVDTPTWSSLTTIWGADEGDADIELGGLIAISSNEIWLIVGTDEDNIGESYVGSKIKRKKTIDGGVNWTDKKTIIPFKGVCGLQALFFDEQLYLIYDHYWEGAESNIYRRIASQQ